MFLHPTLLIAAVSTLIGSAFASKRGHSPYSARSDAVGPALLNRQNNACIDPNPANTVTDRLNIALNSSGPGFVLRLCPNAQYLIQAPILFAAPNQEISTQGYPTDSTRATLVVSGPVANGIGHTNAVDGTCSNCNGVKLRNIQINGTRAGASPTAGGANIEMGGANSDQLIEFVHSYDPRGWSCLHVAEGPFLCNNVTVQNNDIGPCGSDAFQQWADGISVSCRSAIVRNNLVMDPTDGGIVVFGSPGTQVYNNTIWVVNSTLLGGLNLVDYDPWNGNYSGTVVYDNTVIGGFATDSDSSHQTDGVNVDNVIIKIGIAIGPRTWFDNTYGGNVSSSGTVVNNTLTGAFGYGIAMSSAFNFTVQGNVLFENTSFIGSRGPNCSASDPTPPSAAFIVAMTNVTSSSIQSNFQSISDADGLTCILPPDGGDYWPYGGNPAQGNFTPPISSSGPSTPTASHSAQGSGGHSSAGAKAGLAIGIVLGVIAITAAIFFIRRRAVNRQLMNSVARSRDHAGFVKAGEAPGRY